MLLRTPNYNLYLFLLAATDGSRQILSIKLLPGIFSSIYRVARIVFLSHSYAPVIPEWFLCPGYLEVLQFTKNFTCTHGPSMFHFPLVQHNFLQISDFSLFHLYLCSHVFLKLIFSLFLKKILFIFRGEGRETSMCACLSHAPYWGPGLQPRCVPWVGI